MKIVFRLFVLLIFCSAYTQNGVQRLSGVVTASQKPLPGVSILIKESKQGVQTNRDGVYTIAVKTGNVLVFSYLGMQSKEVVVQQGISVLNLTLEPKVEALKEVVVKKKRRKNAVERELEFDANKNLIRTSTGTLDKRKSTLSMTIIDGDELTMRSPLLLTALRIDPRVYVRDRPSLLGGSYPVIYDIDGMVTDSAPRSILTSDIDRIAVIRSLAATARYGSRAMGGVIVINTKRGKFKNSKATKLFKDSLQQQRKLLATSLSIEYPKLQEPPYLEKLLASNSEESALRRFREEVSDQRNPYYLIDAGDYFLKSWGNENSAMKIWDRVIAEQGTNASILKAMAYVFEDNDMRGKALKLYGSIAKLRPNYAQSHRDLANMLQENGKQVEALRVYGRHMLRNKGKENGGTANAIDSIIQIETHKLVLSYPSLYPQELKSIEQTLGFRAIRVLLEWNTGESEFVLQCTNTAKMYTWKHASGHNAIVIANEKRLGYSSKQFFLNAEEGVEWKFNLNYLNNKTPDPTYVKVTIYFDYGKKTERKELRVFRLSQEDATHHLFTIDTETGQLIN